MEKQIVFRRAQAATPDFQALVALLDQELLDRYQEEQAEHAPFNKLASDTPVVVAYAGEQPIACGAFRPDPATRSVEIKRMFVHADHRDRGVGRQVLTELENWARELGFLIAHLETGNQQPEAVALYTRAGYTRIPNYGPYAAIDNSICMEKKL